MNNTHQSRMFIEQKVIIRYIHRLRPNLKKCSKRFKMENYLNLEILERRYRKW